MSLLNTDELRALAQQEASPCVSIYLPTHRAGKEVRQDPIRLKNALRAAARQLQERGMRSAEVEDLLRPGQALAGEESFWRHQSDGLALFIAPSASRHYRLPLAFEELCVVGERYHIKPLLPLLSGDGRFYLLALSKHRVRLFEGSRFSVREMDTGDIPQNLREVVGYDVEERSLQFHTRAPGRGGGRDAVFHGQGRPGDDQREVERFLNVVDDGVNSLIDDPHTPLVLAAVERQIAAYRDISRYPTLVPEAVRGNPDEASAGQLHQAAWALLEPRFDRDRRAAALRYQEVSGSELGSDDLERIVRAAHNGRVDTLFAASDVQVWGTYDAETERARVVEAPDDSAEDLLDRATVDTLLHGGTAYVVPRPEVPGEASAAAIFRYPRP